MNRRHFIGLGLCVVPMLTQALVMDDIQNRPNIWEASSIDSAALALYGRALFATLQESDRVVFDTPSGSIADRENVLLRVYSALQVKSIAIFADANSKSLVAVFHVGEYGVVDYELSIKMEAKGTVFAVMETLDGKLYYARGYIDVITMSCMAS